MRPIVPPFLPLCERGAREGREGDRRTLLLPTVPLERCGLIPRPHFQICVEWPGVGLVDTATARRAGAHFFCPPLKSRIRPKEPARGLQYCGYIAATRITLTSGATVVVKGS